MLLKRIVTLFLALLVVGYSAGAAAVDERPIPEEAFAEQKVALQVSNANPAAQRRVLMVARMVLKEYGMDRVAVEVVGMGPGMKVLLADSKHGDMIASLADQGVRFSACHNTYQFMAKRKGQEPELHPDVQLVPAGVGRLLKLEDAGYTIIKP
jgi:hypothetical protein